MKSKFLGLAILSITIYACASKTAATSSSQVAAAEAPVARTTSTEPSTPAAPLGKAEAVKPPKDSKGNVAPTDLNAGKISYKNNCAKCHDLFSPKEFTREQWAPILVSMQKKAHLSDAEMAPITAYIYAQL
ncbi:MAG: cytochrome c [Bacteroidetes bacterium]|nr:cytochrome c [Bacteroidota bacterium]